MFWPLLKIIFNPIIKKLFRLQIQVQGRENVPVCGAIIIAGNQVSFISVLAIETVLRRKVYWAVSPLACKAKLPKLILKTFCGCFLLDTGRADTRGFWFAFRVLRKSKMLAFYPGIVNQGVALFCLRSGYNILPMAVTQEALHPNRINLTFGRVFNLSEYQRMLVNIKNVDDVICRISQSIEKLKQ